jgi:hypothetical protein
LRRAAKRIKKAAVVPYYSSTEKRVGHTQRTQSGFGCPLITYFYLLPLPGLVTALPAIRKRAEHKFDGRARRDSFAVLHSFFTPTPRVEVVRIGGRTNR